MAASSSSASSASASASAASGGEKPLNSFWKLLSAHKAAELVPPNQQIVVVYKDEEPVVGFERIVANKILSAPVYDKEAHQYIGFLDTKDLVSYIIFKAEQMKADEEAKKASGSLSPRSQLSPGRHGHHGSQGNLPVPAPDIRQIFDVAAKMYQRPLEGITTAYLCRRHPFYAVKEDDSLLVVVQKLALEDCHRVPVMNAEGHIKGIVSQSSIVQFLYKNKDAIKDLLLTTVDGAHLGTRNILPVSSTESALEVFKKMSNQGRSGVPVVDEDGRFIGNTSGSDLKLLIQFPQHTLRMLSVPIIDFLSAIRQLEVSAREKSPTISVRPIDTVERVLGKLAATHVHRVFICDDANGYKPVGVVSLTDLLRYLLNAGIPASVAHPTITVSAN